MHLKSLVSGILIIGVLSFEACDSEIGNATPKATFVSDQTIPEVVDFVFHVKPILSDRCFKCHGPDKNKIEGDLQLHSAETAFAALGEDSIRYAIKPHDVENSEIIKRIFTEDPDDIMPPPESNLHLSPTEKEILKRWIAQGANWKGHWAFDQPVAPEIPQTKNPSWVTNELDYYIIEKLEEFNLSPSDPVRSEKLLRRVSFDLRGLPPSLEEIKSFAEDDSDENYEKIVDHYLASDAFAERMTNDWLDLARYADTHGYQDDLERTMWPWRDWVIHAFKQNMPYDQFVKWQLAGDLLPNPTKEQIIATAFNRNHKITQEGGVIPEEYRAEYVTDRTNTFGTAFLGLTFECAKCHDHKYDPISQKEYYELYSFFNSVAEKGLIEKYGEIPKPYIEITKEEIQNTLQFINNLDTLDRIPLLVMEDLQKPRQTYVLDRGVYDQPTDKVSPNVPGFGKMASSKNLSNRLDLADWLFSDENPLTARVAVNRFWQQIFGKGIVSTSYDFGNQGSLPTHPKLLDHLALKFKADGWDVKNMIKYLVCSSTYKQDSKISPQIQQIDPENKWFARAPRTRLSAEMIRDHGLCISGLLVDEVGGPSVKPYQPSGLWEEVTGGGGGSTAKYIQDEGAGNYRRSLYTFWKRTVPPPNMMLFDTPTRDFCMVQREGTSTPLQALVLMNDPQYLEFAIALAERALNYQFGDSAKKDVPESDIAEIIQYMFTLATSRKATTEELANLSAVYTQERQRFQNSGDLSILENGKIEESDRSAAFAAMSIVSNVIFNLDETIRKS